MNKIFIVGGGKGGVGKTMVTMSVVDSLLEKGEKVILVESDDSNPDTYKALKDLVPSSILNLDTETGYMGLCDIIETNKDTCIVVNTGARATAAIVTHSGIVVDVLRELKRDLVMLWPINRQRDSIELLREFLDGSDGYDATYAVLNTYWGAPEKFMRYNNSKQKNRVTGTIVYPEMNDMVSDKLNDNRLAFSNADASLTLSEKSVLYRFRKAGNSALEVMYG